MQNNLNPELVNLTGHEISIFRGTDVLTIPPSGDICRVTGVKCRASYLTIAGFGSVPLNLTPFSGGRVVNLPPPVDGRVYLVSTMVLQCLNCCEMYRPDVYAPATGLRHGVVRDGWDIKGVTELMGIDYGRSKFQAQVSQVSKAAFPPGANHYPAGTG